MSHNIHLNDYTRKVVKQILLDRRVSQDDLARMANVSQSSVSKLINGKNLEEEVFNKIVTAANKLKEQP